MLDSLLALGQRQRSATDSSARRWISSIGLGAGIGFAYFLTAHLSLRLVLQPEGVAVFWPAAGITSGILIAFGPNARWAVAAGAMVATVAAHIPPGDPLWAGGAFGLCNAAEALITGGLIERYSRAGFSLGRVRHVLGLLGAALAATFISGIGGAVTYRLMVGPSAPMLTSLWHWMASDAFGIVTVAPIVIGVAAAVREPPRRREIIEGSAALLALAAMTGIVISLPPNPWEILLPIAWLFPMLLWLAARCRPVFSAAAAFLVSISIVWTTVFGIGHFGDRGLPIEDRVLQAQAAILVVALGAFILAALFAERRESEARLARSKMMLERSNMMLERERDNRLTNAQAIVAAIAHEVRQPLAAVAINAGAALRFLGRAPPDHDEVQKALNRIKSESHRTSEVFDSFRALFGKVDQERQPIDMNELILGVLQSLERDLQDGGVAIRPELPSELPTVEGHRAQLQQVIYNLVNNDLPRAAIRTPDRRRAWGATPPSCNSRWSDCSTLRMSSFISIGCRS